MTRFLGAVVGLAVLGLLAGCDPAIKSTQDLSITDLLAAFPIDDGVYSVGGSSVSQVLATRSVADRGYNITDPDDTNAGAMPSLIRFLKDPQLPTGDFVVQLYDKQSDDFEYYLAAVEDDAVVVFMPRYTAPDVRSPTQDDLPPALHGLVEYQTDGSLEVKDPANTLDVVRVAQQLGWPSVVAVYAEQPAAR